MGTGEIIDSTGPFGSQAARGLLSEEKFLREAFSRNIGLVTPAEQDILSRAKIAIPGMGGVGGNHLLTLVRTGFTRFHLSDFDTFEPANLNRQAGARVSSFGKKKLDVMAQDALEINPYLQIQKFPEGLAESNVDAFLDGVAVVLDGLDFFNFPVRRLLFNKAREKGIYVVTAGPMGFSSALLVFSPYEGMSFDEYFDVARIREAQDQHLSFAMGLAPSPTHLKYMDLSRVDLNKKAGPSLAIACAICSGMAATETVRIVLKRGKIQPVPAYFQFDPFSRKYRRGRLRFGNRNPLQRLKIKVLKAVLKRRSGAALPAAPAPPEVAWANGGLGKGAMEFLLKAAVRAPSGDNAQPWKFSPGKDAVAFGIDRDADHSFFNVRHLASVISCGAALQNAAIAAQELGLSVRIETDSDLPGPDFFGEIRLEPGASEGHPLFPSIWRRHTNRKMYRRAELDSRQLVELAAAAGEDGFSRLRLLSGQGQVNSLARLIFKADRIRTEHPELHEHLYKMIRFSPEEAEQKLDGFPLGNLEAGTLGNLFLKSTRSWRVMNLLNKCGLSRVVPFQSYLLAKSSSAIGLLSVPGFEAGDLFRGGMALQRVWLTATRLGLAMQPMASLSLFLLRWQLEGESSFSDRHRAMLRETFEEYQELFADLSFRDNAQVMLFRLGFAEPIRHPTYRKEIRSFLASHPGKSDLVLEVVERFREAERRRPEERGLSPQTGLETNSDKEKPLCS